MKILEKSEYLELFEAAEVADIFQHSAWASAASNLGWQDVIYLTHSETTSGTEVTFLIAAQIKSIPVLGSYISIIHGPIVLHPERHSKLIDNWPDSSLFNDTINEEPFDEVNNFISALHDFALRNNYFVLLIEPLAKSSSSFEKRLLENGYFEAQLSNLPKFPLYIDLEQDEISLINSFTKTTRYNINYAKKQGVVVSSHFPTSENLHKVDEFYEHLTQFSLRKGFTPLPKAYFYTLWKNFAGTKNLAIIETSNNGEVTSVNFSQFWKNWAGSYFTVNLNKYPKLKSSYLLKWETMLIAKELGVKIFDMWGYVPNAKEDDPDYGYSQFKLGFNPKSVQMPGRLIKVTSPFRYTIWRLLNKIKSQKI